MSHPVDWDVEQYKVASESEQQWKLRRDFLEKWKAEIPEDRLVCLARVFINVEFLGCRYPLPVMKQIAELSKEVSLFVFKLFLSSSGRLAILPYGQSDLLVS